MKPIIYNLNNIRPPLTGIGRYSIELIREMLIQRPNLTAIKNGKSHTGSNLAALLMSFDAPTKKQPSTSHADQLISARKLRSIIGNIPLSRSIYRKLDRYYFSLLSKPLITNGAAYHDLNYSLSPKSSSCVSTVYDLSNVICPETHPAHRVNYLNSYFEKLRSGDSKIITISDAVKSELMEYYGISNDRIDVTHLAADSSFHPRTAQECRSTLEAHTLSYKKYVLCVATVEPRKNLSAVLSAYELLDKHVQQEFPLVMVGPLGWKSTALEKRIRQLNDLGVVKQLGFVAQKKLPMLYSGATAFVYPSLYEGFGLPLLEAMQSGCPCITSNAGALAEVSNGSAIQVDPQKSDDIAQQLNLLLHNADLHSYYVNAGQQRASNFTWAKTAFKTCEIYDSL
jgi:glycosyltransferase involved in cell wall biosynthesis